MRQLLPAALVLALACASLAKADTMTQSDIFPTVTIISAASQFPGFALSNPIKQFDPSLGTLTGYSLTLAGSATSTDIKAPYLIFAELNSGTVVSLMGSQVNAFQVTGTDTRPSDLQKVTGTHLATLYVNDLSYGPASVTTLTFTRADLTYSYTPAGPLPAATPEPSGFLMLGTATLGLAGLARRKLFTSQPSA